jgi:hypothetical protein
VREAPGGEQGVDQLPRRPVREASRVVVVFAKKSARGGTNVASRVGRVRLVGVAADGSRRRRFPPLFLRFPPLRRRHLVFVFVFVFASTLAQKSW